MRFLEYAWNWNATAEEWETAYPCDKHVHGPHRVLMRAVDVNAPASVLYRWVCQLTLAPYSYDLLDNLGRRSPRQLTPGADDLALGQRLMKAFTVVGFEVDRHVTATAAAGRLCGAVSLTYATVPAGPASSRLVARCDIECRTRWDQLRVYALAWGDLVMMRKQFLTLKELAEQSAREDASTPVM